MKIVARPIKYVDDWGVSQTLHFVFVNNNYEIWKGNANGIITKLYKATNMAMATLHWEKYKVALERTGEYDLADIEIL